MLMAIIALWFARGVPEGVKLGFSGVGHRHFLTYGECGREARSRWAWRIPITKKMRPHRCDPIFS